MVYKSNSSFPLLKGKFDELT